MTVAVCTAILETCRACCDVPAAPCLFQHGVRRRSEWVEFNAPLDTIQVISEAEYDEETVVLACKRISCFIGIYNFSLQMKKFNSTHKTINSKRQFLNVLHVFSFFITHNSCLLTSSEMKWINIYSNKLVNNIHQTINKIRWWWPYITQQTKLHVAPVALVVTSLSHSSRRGVSTVLHNTCDTAHSTFPIPKCMGYIACRDATSGIWSSAYKLISGGICTHHSTLQLKCQCNLSRAA